MSVSTRSSSDCPTRNLPVLPTLFLLLILLVDANLSSALNVCRHRDGGAVGGSALTYFVNLKYAT